MRALLFCLPILLLQVCHFCSGENHQAYQSSCYAARERMQRLTKRLIVKFVRQQDGKLIKLFDPEKGIKAHRDTKDVNLLKYVVAISGFHSVGLHKKLGKQNSAEAIEYNKQAIHKFIARIYTMIVDAPINSAATKTIRKLEPLFAPLSTLREKVEKKDDKQQNLDLEPAPKQKGESVYHLFFMPTKALVDIKKNNLNEHKIKGFDEAYKQMIKVMNFINNDVLNGHIDIFSNPEKFQELLKEKAPTPNELKEAKEEAIKWLERKKKETAEEIEKMKDAGEIDENEAAKEIEKMETEAAKEMEKIEKMKTTQLHEIFRILAINAGYDVKKYDVNEVKDKEKLKSKLVKMLTDLYLCIWNSEIFDWGFYKIYGKIYNDLMIVKEYYINEHKMNWEAALKEAKIDLGGRLKEGIKKYNANGDSISETWGWIYASDNFLDAMWKEERTKNNLKAFEKLPPFETERSHEKTVEGSSIQKEKLHGNILKGKQHVRRHSAK